MHHIAIVFVRFIYTYWDLTIRINHVKPTKDLIILN
ncbi:unnamed protein product [Tenebrio molitor]|nr:unnamed protein product [Tenebrio molitor]